MEELQNLVKSQGQGFDVHKVQRDSAGQERYLKMEKDEFLTSTNTQKMGLEVGTLLQGKSWEERYNWVQGQKDEGNKLFKQNSYAEAVDAYLKALCGLDFGKDNYLSIFSLDQTAEQEERINLELKAPILNNIAMTLIKQGKYQRSQQMLDQVLQCDPENFKAWTRKVQNHVRLCETEQARKTLQKFEKLAVTLEDKATLTGLYKEIAQQTLKEKNFSQKIFGAASQTKAGGLRYSKMEELMQEYENEHLATLSNTQWLLYPYKKFFKVICRKIGLCRRRDTEDFDFKDKQD